MIIRVLISLSLVCLLAGCGSDGQTRTDQHGLITYEIPEGWEAVPGSNETRFRPSSGPLAAEIQVSTMLIDEPRNLEAERDQWLGFQEKQGNAILLNEAYMGNGFFGVAYAHQTETSIGASIQHHVQMQGPGVLVSTYLMVPEDQYAEMLPVYEAVLESIQPAD